MSALRASFTSPRPRIHTQQDHLNVSRAENIVQTMFRCCLLALVTFLAMTDAAKLPRKLFYNNKTAAITTQAKDNKARTKQALVCLPPTSSLDLQNLPSYTLKYVPAPAPAGNSTSNDTAYQGAQGNQGFQGDQGDQGAPAPSGNSTSNHTGAPVVQFTQVGGSVYFWSPVYDCNETLGAITVSLERPLRGTTPCRPTHLRFSKRSLILPLHIHTS